jgi:Tfp pilus assembly protein PilN
MLRTNLSTRPFYNTHAVHVMLGAFALLVLAITLFNVVETLRLSGRQSALGARASEAEAEATRQRGEAARIRAQIDPKELEVVSAAAREANAIIDQRAFSWTGLFAQLEATLPENVRVTAIRPSLDREGGFVVSMAVEARRVEDLDAFMEALEKESTFHSVRPVEERPAESGLIEAIVEGTYEAPVREVPSPPPAQGAAR